MTPALRAKLEALLERREELGRLLADPGAAADPARLARLNREYARLGPLAEALDAEQRAREDLAAAIALGDDPDLSALAADERRDAEARLAALDQQLLDWLLPRDARDGSDLYLEVRAGTGGDEAALFAGDLLRMYLRYAERRGWSAQLESATPGEHGGYREAIARIAGDDAWSRLRFESGTHRVQRVPATESQGRIHTSAATVAIIPADDDGDEAIEINPAELKVDTFRASGAGGQHVNKTESAIRITHLPSGLVVESQAERSQHANRERAMQRLRSMLRADARARREAANAASRKLQVGSGDRSQRIRTWNVPQGRVTDHRVEGLTLYSLEALLDGDLDPLLDRLASEHRAEELTALAANA
jgi:peptide chain release factor 1